MNQLTLITPMPRAWDHTAHDVPANASGDLVGVPAVYDYQPLTACGPCI